MNSDTHLRLIGAIHLHHKELRMSPLCVDMCEYVLGLRTRKPMDNCLPIMYSPLHYLINNFQDQLRRTLPDVYATIYSQP